MWFVVGWGLGIGSLPPVVLAEGGWAPEAFADYLLSGQTPHPAVVRIVAAEQGGASLGSGVLVDANPQQGLVLTNWHVVRDSRSAVLVQFPDGFQTAGTVIRMDEAWDLAAVVIWKPPATPIPLAATNPVPGDLLTIAGYGRGPFRAQSGRCTEYLSPATGYPKEFVELAAGARQGDSGGPILNERGELAGVLFGQNGGRTIGSCSTRLRAFLATVGSRGFVPPPAGGAALADGRGPGDTEAASRFRMAAANLEGPGEPSRSGFGLPSESWLPPQQQLASPPPAWPTQASPTQAWPTQVWQAPSWHSGLRIPSLAELAVIFDPTANGKAMLSAAGGLALVILGARVLRGGRRGRAEMRAGGPE